MHVQRARGKEIGLCFRVMYMGKEHMERKEGCVSGSCTCTCEKSIWKGERVVFPVSVHVSSLGRYVFGSEISYNKPPPRLPGLGC